MKALFPYPTLFGDVTVTVGDVTIDDEVVGGRVDVDQRTVSLHGLSRSEWKTARISLVVAAPPSEIDEAKDVVCIAVVNCGPTNTRISVELEEDPASPGRWTGELELERDYWYSRADLRCAVVATVDDTGNRLIGEAEMWTLLFDDLPNRPVNGAIKITWVDFDDPGDRTWLRRYTDNYVYLSIDPDEPQLFLNRGFDGLEQLLADRRRRHLDRALHDQTRASIAQTTWTSLFNAAIGSVEADEETGDPAWPTGDWQRAVLEVLLARMYPDKSPDEALREAWSARSSPEGSGTLQALLGPAAAMQVRAPRLLRDGIRVMSHELENDEEGSQ
jgi:hypothetical protein